MLKGSGAVIQFPQLQAAARLGAAITQNVWSVVLDTTKNVDVYSIIFAQDTVQEDLEVRITDDVGAETLTQTAVAGTPYFIRRNSDCSSSSRYHVTATFAELSNSLFLISSRTMKIEIRKTTAAGANPTRLKALYQKTL